MGKKMEPNSIRNVDHTTKRKKPLTQLDKARQLHDEHGRLSVSFLQRKLRINADAAKKLVNKLNIQ